MLLSGRLVMQISGTCRRFSTGISARISLDSPELDSAMTTSCGVTIPRSPCAASPGWTKKEEVPVLELLWILLSLLLIQLLLMLQPHLKYQFDDH